MPMMNYIWAGMMLLSLITAVFTGRLDATVQAAMTASKDAIFIVLGFAGIMCMWTGIMKIAEKSGLVGILSRLARPIGKLLFPEVPVKSQAMDAIMMNVMANLLGMGNAATPMGIKAMQEMSKLNDNSHTATNGMCVFMVMNTACFQLIPSTIIAIRSGAGSASPAVIMVPIWCASLVGLAVGLLVCKAATAFRPQADHRPKREKFIGSKRGLSTERGRLKKCS